MIPSIPDSPIAQAAAALAAEAEPVDLLNHSYRTYLFGRYLVAEPGIDEEAAFVAAMLHDLGLAEDYRGEAEFARVGADHACRFLEGRGWDPDRIHLVEEAILRHANIHAEEVPEYRVIQAGAALDVGGLGYEHVRRDDLSGVLRAYPRLGFASHMRDRFLGEIRRHPEGSFAELERALGATDLMGANPIDRLEE
ncbi:HD domain-containing protein [Streptosporangium jomthongense]|uniref:HD domain-containing protein n=1 Tax=Streptosporangium jomthongense TaxID=1193683 RepID=A0ABV8EWK3_9ACTN